MSIVKVLAINSFAVHGTASLKATISILGSKILPVPSVMLNGLTNMPFVQRHTPAFRELLEGTFKLVVHRNQKVILYIGYLGSSDQVDIILDLIGVYREYIQLILTDPISGDHGRTYVPDEIIMRWPDLIRISDFVFPNLTELKLITGYAAIDDQNIDVYLESFQKQFPTTGLIVTSITSDETKIGILLRHAQKKFQYSHQLLPQSFGGTGDTFLSYFILYYFFDALSIENAVRSAAEKTLERILFSIQEGADELLV